MLKSHSLKSALHTQQVYTVAVTDGGDTDFSRMFLGLDVLAELQQTSRLSRYC